MTVGVVKSQGTEVYFVDTVSGSTPQLRKLSCPTGVQGLGGPRDQIEDTCLDTIGDKTYQAGLGNTGQVTVPFNLIPRQASHQVLFQLKENGSVLKWIAVLSEGTSAPTLESDGEINAPTDRSSFEFDAYVADVNIDIATNDLVRGTLLLQRSGSVRFNAYVPA